VNKFEALKQFQAWPPEHQRLCAEYWIETGEDRPAVQVWTTADKIQTAGELVQRGVALPMPGDPWPFDQPKAAKVAAVKPIRNCMAYTSEELSEVDSHLVRGLGPTEVAKIMMRKHKGHRTKESWRKMAQMAQYIRKRNSLAAADRAIDAEVE
jgi:hypothetical protein